MTIWICVTPTQRFRLLHLRRWALVLWCLVAVVGVLAVALVRPTLAAPLHPPDVHSSTLHRTLGSLMESAEPLLAGPMLLVIPRGSRVSLEQMPHPGSVAIAPPDHPPR